MKAILVTEAQYKKRFPKVKPFSGERRQPDMRYRAPAHFQLRNKSWKLVHGFITFNGERLHHAWVEHKGLVVDLYYSLSMTQEEFYRVYEVKKVKRFSIAQTRMLMDKHRSYFFRHDSV